MQDLLWLEFIGLWGTGKSTLINKLKKDLKKYNINVETSSSYFKLKKSSKFFIIFYNFFKTFETSIFISYILINHFIRLKIKKNNLGTDLIKTFFLCYQSRIFSLFNSEKNYFLWEGEFHLIPFLDLDYKKKERLVSLLLKISKPNYVRFVYLNIPLNKTIENINFDQKTKKNIRFSKYQLKIYKKYQVNAIQHQNELIEILNKKGFFIYNIDENCSSYNSLLEDVLNHRK